jgi:phage recombination protein Bet
MTGNDIATRNGNPPAYSQAALAIKPGQPTFDEHQRAALATLGIKADAPQADLDVFLHVSQRMGLDPFAKQIHLIYYRVNDPYYDRNRREWVDNWVEKPSIQTGIGGFRVQRDRVAKREGILIDYEDTLWFKDDGTTTDAWLWDDPPTACRVVTKISDGRRFPATIRFNEFAKRNKKGDLTGRWRDGHSYQIEKCAEAASLRKAFPQDFAGLDLDVEVESDPDAPPPAPPAPPRVTAAEIQQRAARQHGQPVRSVTVTPPPEDAPWPGDAAPARPARRGDHATGEVIPDTSEDDPRAAVLAAFDALKVAGPEIPGFLTRWSGHEYASVDSLSAAAAGWFAGHLGKLGSRDELEAVVVAAEARREQDLAAEAGDATGEATGDGQ